MTSMNKPLRWADRASAGVGDLRVFAANWLVVPLDEAIERAQQAALRQAIDRCVRAQREWLDSEIRLREAVIERSADTAAKNAELGRVVISCEAHVDRLSKRLADLSIEIARYFDPLKHPRWPQGDPRSWGGRFRDRDGGGIVPAGSKFPKVPTPPVRPVPGNPPTGQPPANPTGKPPTTGPEQRPPRRDDGPVVPPPRRPRRPLDRPEVGEPPSDLPIEEAAEKLQRDLAGGVYQRTENGNYVVDEELTKLAISATVEKGKKDGYEWVFIVEQRTGEFNLPRTDESPTFVDLGANFRKATILEPNLEWEVHHNHPDDISLSHADLLVLATYPNVKRIVAHTHDGGHFSAILRPLPTSNLASAQHVIGEAYGRARDLAFEEMGRSEFGRRLNGDEFERLRTHVANLILAESKMIDYAYFLSPAMKRMVELGGGQRVLDRIVTRASQRLDMKALLNCRGVILMAKQRETMPPNVDDDVHDYILEEPPFYATRDEWVQWLEWLRSIPKAGLTVSGAIRYGEQILRDFDSGKWPPPSWRERLEEFWAKGGRANRVYRRID